MTRGPFQLYDLSGQLYPASHTAEIYREALLTDGPLWGGRVILAMSRHVTPEQVRGMTDEWYGVWRDLVWGRIGDCGPEEGTAYPTETCH